MRCPAMAFLRRLLTVCSLAAGVTLAPATRAATAGAERALLIGSSSVSQEFGRIISRALERNGYHVTRRGVTSAGFARPDYRDVQALMEHMSVDRQTAVVLVYLGVNDGQSLWLRPAERASGGRRWLAWSDERWSRVYEQRARRFVERLCERGARRVLVLLPVDVAGDRLQHRLQRIRRLQARAAAATTCGAAIRTGGDIGHFDGAGLARRRRDGFHMTRHGARVVWERIRWRALQSIPGGRRARVEGRFAEREAR